MIITNVTCPKGKYPVKCPYETTMEGITVHNTANDASAMQEVSYMLSNNNKVSYHAAVDNTRVVTALPFNRSCFAAGDGATGFGNLHTINIEICYSKSGGDRFNAAEELAAEYIAYLLNLYGWGIDRVGTHQMRSGKYCPHRTLDYGWDRFLDKIKYYLNLKLADIADLELYNNLYEDLRLAFGGDKDKLWQHLCTHGIKEGRRFSYVYDPKYYKEHYPDLQKAFGNDWWAYLDHYLNNGCKENRQAIEIYSVEWYKNHNEQAIKEMNNVNATKHFIKFGINEWRDTAPKFNVRAYKEKNKDLQKAFRNNCKDYYTHYIQYGYKENRKYT